MTAGKLRRPGGYFSYVLIYFFYFFTMAVFGSVLSVYLTKLGKPAGEMSFIVSAASVFSFAVVPLMGYLVDRTGRSRQISVAFLIAIGVLGLVFSACRETWSLFLLHGAIMALINTVNPVCERMAGASPYRYGSVRVWGTFGYAAGAQAAGLALEFLPSSALFVMMFCSSLLAVLGFWGAGGGEPAPAPEKAQAAPRKHSGAGALAKDPMFLLFLVIALLFFSCSGVNMTYAPVLLTTLGIPEGAVGTVLFFSTLVEIPIILFSNKFMDRLSSRVLILLTFGVITAQFLCYGFTRSAAVAVTVMILLKAIASTMFVMIDLKVVRNLADPRFTTTGLSLINSVNCLGTILLQNLSGPLVERAGIHTLYLLMAGLAVLGSVLTLFLKVGNREKVFS